MNQISDPSHLLELIQRARDGIVSAASLDGRADSDPAAMTALYRELAQMLQARELYLQLTQQQPAAIEPDLEGRAVQFGLLQDAVAALRGAQPVRAARRAIGAHALDPIDQHSEIVIAQAISLLNGSRLGPVSADGAARLQPPTDPFIHGARSFITLADGRELVTNPELFGAWARAFTPADDATLAILVDPGEVAAQQEALAQALDAVGVGADTELDLAIVSSTQTAESELARDAHAILSDQHDRWRGALAELPRFSSAGSDLTTLLAAAKSRWHHGPLGRSLRVAIKIPPRDWSDAVGWGDTFFALQFARELTRRGHLARLDLLPEWDLTATARGAGEPDDVVIHLRGPFPYIPEPGSLNVLWNISRPSRVTARECDAFDLVAAPSARRAEELAAITSTPVMLLPQATDPANCWPEPDPAFVHELTFVANTRGVHRQIMRDLLPTERDLAVWGKGWRGLIPDRYVAGEALANDQLRRAYSSAAIVLNDHMDDQIRHGIINNRIYDVLACGGCVLSDHLPELDGEFKEIVPTYRTPEDLRVTVERLLADPAERAERAALGRALVLREHTFGHRADALLAAVAGQLTIAA
jgi:Glycosyl transferases group 1